MKRKADIPLSQTRKEQEVTLKVLEQPQEWKDDDILKFIEGRKKNPDFRDKTKEEMKG